MPEPTSLLFHGMEPCSLISTRSFSLYFPLQFLGFLYQITTLHNSHVVAAPLSDFQFASVVFKSCIVVLKRPVSNRSVTKERTHVVFS